VDYYRVAREALCAERIDRIEYIHPGSRRHEEERSAAESILLPEELLEEGLHISGTPDCPLLPGDQQVEQQFEVLRPITGLEPHRHIPENKKTHPVPRAYESVGELIRACNYVRP